MKLQQTNLHQQEQILSVAMAVLEICTIRLCGRECRDKEWGNSSIMQKRPGWQRTPQEGLLGGCTGDQAMFWCRGLGSDLPHPSGTQPRLLRPRQPCLQTWLLSDSWHQPCGCHTGPARCLLWVQNRFPDLNLAGIASSRKRVNRILSLQNHA